LGGDAVASPGRSHPGATEDGRQHADALLAELPRAAERRELDRLVLVGLHLRPVDGDLTVSTLSSA
jgi:hypothetical protein